MSQNLDDAESKPVLLMLFLASSDIAALEQSLHLELELNVETHRLVVEESVSFSASSLTERMNEIRSMATAYRADAVIWLEPNGEHGVTLQLVVVAPGQSTVRSIDTRIEDNNIGELVIATRELLNDIYIPMKERPSPTSALQSNPKARVSPPLQPRSTYQLGFGAEFIGDPRRDASLAALLGGLVCGRFQTLSGLFIESTFTVFGTPSKDIYDGELQTFGIRPGLGFGYTFEPGIISWGPNLQFQLIHQWTNVSLIDGDTLSDSWWDLRIVPAADIRFHLASRTSLLLRTGLGIHLRQQMYKRTSDASTIYSTPYLDGSITISFIFNLN